MTDTTESYPSLPPSPLVPNGILFPSSKHEPPPYIRTSFSSGYIRSNSTHALASAPSPIVTSPSTPSLRRHSQSRGHRHTQSLNAQAIPPPLPLPKDHVDAGYHSNKEDSDDRADTLIRQWRLKRSESMSPHSPDKKLNASPLPDNPKLWTPSQLAQYLLTALRFKVSKSSEAIIVPKPVAQDIANFVVKCKLNGRVFLRLAEKDIEELGVNQLWRSALLSSSLELRKNLLKGRIWGFGPEEDAVINARSPHDHGRRVPSTVLEREEPSSRTSALASPVHSSSHWSDYVGNQPEGYLSRSSSVLSFGSDRSSQYVARSRVHSTSSVASSGIGRVQEMVRNLERSQNALHIEVNQMNETPGIPSGEMASKGEEDQEADAAGNNTVIVSEPEGLEPRPSDEHTLFHATLDPVVTAPAESPVTSQSSSTSESVLIETPPLLPAADSPTIPQQDSIPSFHDPGDTKWVAPNEEPTIEALLQEEGGIQEGRCRTTSWGANAWEADFPGGTSRRVPTSAPITRAGPKSSVDDVVAQGETVVVSRAIWNDLCRRLDETERRLAVLEKQEAERNQGKESLSQETIDDRDGPKSSSPGGLSPVTLPPYLLIVGVGVCALVAHLVLGRVVGRRPRL
ncbi:hypothetical protein FRC07_000054 [Ceratobasidium sp. 392]|nr:hypothetical protein FRC07_000054 [Ceratobasidium sp. 392]